MRQDTSWWFIQSVRDHLAKRTFLAGLSSHSVPAVSAVKRSLNGESKEAFISLSSKDNIVTGGSQV